MTMTPAILYVEDDAHSRRVMHMLLRLRMKLPHVTFFEDSSDFVTRLQALNPRPDVVFLDIHVKPCNGFEMLKMLREDEQYKDVPIVALTASVMTEEVQLLRKSGFNGCLAKPIDLDTFPNILSSILDGETIWRIV